MYPRAAPPHEASSPSAPATVFDGTVRRSTARRSISPAGRAWSGTTGASSTRSSWIWLHGLGFQGRGADTWLDVAVGRIALGPVTTPWVANGALEPGRRAVPVLGGLGRRVTVVAEDDHCVLRLPGKHVTVIATAAAPAKAFVECDYANPDGTTHRVVNYSIADTRVHVERPDAEPMALLPGPHRAAYELGRH